MIDGVDLRMKESEGMVGRDGERCREGDRRRDSCEERDGKLCIEIKRKIRKEGE